MEAICPSLLRLLHDPSKEIRNVGTKRAGESVDHTAAFGSLLWKGAVRGLPNGDFAGSGGFSGRGE